jgi:hypothetical protein
MQKTIAILVSLILASLAPQAKADIIFNNLNNGNYSQAGNYFSANNDPSTFETAQDFPLSATYRLDSITIPLRVVSGPNDVTIRLYSSSGGLPNTVLESWTVDNAMGTSNYNLVTVNSVLHPLLLTGGQYFVDVRAPVGGEEIDYPASSLSTTNTLVQSFDLGATWSLRLQGTFTEFEAFEVQGTPTQTPEPASLTLLGTGLLAFGGFQLRRWRRKPSTT